MKHGKILALDYGTKNVGLACSDVLAVTVRPLPSVPNLGRKSLLVRLEAAIRENQIDKLVVGVPWNMDGTSGEGVKRILSFIDLLRKELDIPVQGVDERLSSVEASSVWNEMTKRQRKRYRTMDSLAAAIILQRFIEEY